jgi:hypothetical protein
MLKCILVPLKNLIHCKVVKKSYAFYGIPQDHFLVHNIPLFVPIGTNSQIKQPLTLSSHLLKIRFVIILLSATTSSKQLFPSHLRLTTMNEFLIFIHPTCPVSLIILDLITRTRRSIQNTLD